MTKKHFSLSMEELYESIGYESTSTETAIKAIRQRVSDDYCTIPQPDHGVMLADLRYLIVEIDRLQAENRKLRLASYRD